MKYKIILILFVLFGAVACAEKAKKPAPVAEEIKAAVTNEQVVVETQATRTQVSLPESVLFNSGDVQLTAEGKKTLREIAPVIEKYPDYSILVEGHTDSKPIGAKLAKIYPTNQALSKGRAATVERFLKNQGKVSQSITVKGKGEMEPVGDNATAEGRVQNRRVQIILIP